MLPLQFPVTSHTKHVGPGSTFVAVNGQKEQGITYIPQALQHGATTIVVAQDDQIPTPVVELINISGACLVRVENPRLVLAQLSALAAGFPANKLKIIAVTGTKGKTTTSWILAHLFKTAGYKTALLSTARNRILDQELPTELTTPQPDYIHVFLKQCVAVGVEWVIMEVAAQAVSLHRVAGIEFDGVIFTNFSPTHGEFYSHMHDYFIAKCGVLAQVKKNAPIVLNGDDAQVAQLVGQYPQSITISAQDTTASIYVMPALSEGTGIAWRHRQQGMLYDFSCPALVGEFNRYNLSAAAALACACGVTFNAMSKAFASFKGVPGRLERYQLPNSASCFIDYAHTPSSFGAVLPLLKSLTDNLIVVFGAGGDRDRTMRPAMGAIAVQIADHVILTTDNPRSEKAEDICAQIVAGVPSTQMHKVIIELDREAAIKKAYRESTPTTIIALLGKGPDEYQQFGTTKIPFSERAIVQAL